MGTRDHNARSGAPAAITGATRHEAPNDGSMRAAHRVERNAVTCCQVRPDLASVLPTVSEARPHPGGYLRLPWR